ncbi:MAG: putative oxidoreductase of aldo/keto reductase family [Candidatus Aminicenantes bacterium]|nr:putative oxidoreductase of aldo/keto reductase family [Candidatus Aminicenantes bacterium]
MSYPRRKFLKNLALGGLASMSRLRGSPRPVENQEPKDKKSSLGYRRLGRTGLAVSEISLGGSPLPDWSLFREIIDRGVNYIDTSTSYSNGNSERQIGRLFKEIGRDKVFVCTKFHLRDDWDRSTILRSVEGSLERLKTDYVDVLSIHGAERPEDLLDERVAAAFEGLKKEGKCRFSGLSCHSNHEKVVRTAVESGRFDVVQVGYNVFDIEEPSQDVEAYDDYLGVSRMRDLIGMAAEHNVGVIAMKTLKVGGRRQNLDRYRAGTTSVFQAMLKWVLEDRRVASAVTEILNRQQMEEDLAAAGTPLTPQERAALWLHVAENGRDYCRLCARCRRSCPSRLATTEILRLLAYHESYGKTDAARAAYAALAPGETAPACRDCGSCEKACPYGVRIREGLRRAHSILAG